MPNCLSCTAPLPANTSRCSYCGTRNDMDFSVINRYAVSRAISPRYCPDCEIPLQSIFLDIGDKFAIERCDSCYGLFFDPGEVQAFLEASVSPVFEINYKQIVNLSKERGSGERSVRYIKCPECSKMMNRVSFGYRSGVVVDQCKAHGIWLDNSELVQLMEWKLSGGQMLEEQRERARREEQENARAKTDKSPRRMSERTFGTDDDFASFADPLDDLVGSAVDFISRLFR